MNYYRLYSEVSEGQWYLGGIYLAEEEIDEPSIFAEGKPVDEKTVSKLSVKLYQKGVELDYTITSPDAIPVVSENLSEWLFEYMDEIQLLPVTIDGARSRYSIMVIKNLIDCIDEENSDILYFDEGNKIRPDLVGQYRMIDSLKIHTDKIDKAIFRLSKFDIWVVVNEKLKHHLEKANLTGLKFKLID